MRRIWKDVRGNRRRTLYPILRAVERGEGHPWNVFAFKSREVTHGPDELIAIHVRHADVAYDASSTRRIGLFVTFTLLSPLPSRYRMLFVVQQPSYAWGSD
jgi:hypothetical protein